MSIVPRCRVCLPGRAGPLAPKVSNLPETQRAQEVLSQDEISEVALRYVLRHSAVSTVTSGVCSVRDLERDTAVADGLLAEQGQKLKAHG